METGGSPGASSDAPLRAPADVPVSSCGPAVSAVTLPNPRSTPAASAPSRQPRCPKRLHPGEATQPEPGPRR
ncbi:chaplin family protein [Streptomyces sp. NPDC091682]|uniref:chaplin family protein n=1 Tax=unclassified Streptomyces TaxID=2593676 RepID=UPI0037F954CC